MTFSFGTLVDKTSRSIDMLFLKWDDCLKLALSHPEKGRSFRLCESSVYFEAYCHVLVFTLLNFSYASLLLRKNKRVIFYLQAFATNVTNSPPNIKPPSKEYECLRVRLKYLVITDILTRELVLKGMLIMVDLLVKISCFVRKKGVFSIKTSWYCRNNEVNRTDPSPSVRTPCPYLNLESV